MTQPGYPFALHALERGLPADLACALALAGRREEARRILREVEALPDGPRKRDAAFSLGRAHVALGEPDSAFARFDRADWRWPHRGNRYDPALDPVRADPASPGCPSASNGRWV